MTIHFKDQVIYLVLMSVLCYLGTLFIDQFTVIDSIPVFYSSWLVQVILLLNAVIVFFIAQAFTQNRWNSLIAASLYLVSPFHLEAFILPFQIQYLMAESLLIVYVWGYVYKYFNLSTVVLILASTLNSKLLALMPFHWISDSFTKKQKVYSALASIVILAFVFPSFGEATFLDNLKSLVFIFENLMVPISFPFLNYSIIVPGYYSELFSGLFALGILGLCIYIYKLNLKNANLIISIIACSLIGTVLPIKSIYTTEDTFFYFTPGIYPGFLLSSIGLIILLLIKFNNRSMKIGLTCVAVLWLAVNVNLQKSWRSSLNAWDSSLSSLPAKIYYDEMIKYKWATVLLEKGQDKKAEALIIESKNVFRNERWYRLHLGLAVKNKDEGAIDRINDELIKNKIPYADTKKMQKKKF